MHAAEPNRLHRNWFAEFGTDAALHTALTVLAQQGWQIFYYPGTTGTGLFHLTKVVNTPAGGQRQIRNILNRTELVAFAFGVEHAIDPVVINRHADPLDVIDWHAAPPARPSRGNSAFLACMILLGLCLAVLAWVGALEVIDNTLTLYRSLQS